MVFEFQGAYGMGDVLQGVADAVGEVVGWVNHPSLADVVMGGVANAVQHGVAHVQVWRGHVDSGPQHVGAVGKLAGPHASEQIEVFINRAIAVRAVGAGLGQRATGGADLGLGEAADKRLAFANQLQGAVVEHLEVV